MYPSVEPIHQGAVSPHTNTPSICFKPCSCPQMVLMETWRATRTQSWRQEQWKRLLFLTTCNIRDGYTDGRQESFWVSRQTRHFRTVWNAGRPQILHLGLDAHFFLFIFVWERSQRSWPGSSCPHALPHHIHICSRRHDKEISAIAIPWWHPTTILVEPFIHPKAWTAPRLKLIIFSSL